MEIEFRKFSEFSKGILSELLKQGYSFDLRYTNLWMQQWKEEESFFYEHLDIADACGFITTLEDKPIGFITWDPRKLPDLVEIGNNCIATNYQGLGYGKMQLQEAIRRIRLLNPGKIIVTTNQKLVSAQKNYESLGFILKGQRANQGEFEFAGEFLDYELR